mmetsp:Transcript_89750/g.187510  ORF Transcript_89750/g.187510 Transcript_89750/m.187510 type:complete len:96 (-) Transcript_89750:267-554(-)
MWVWSNRGPNAKSAVGRFLVLRSCFAPRRLGKPPQQNWETHPSPQLRRDLVVQRRLAHGEGGQDQKRNCGKSNRGSDRPNPGRLRAREKAQSSRL